VTRFKLKWNHAVLALILLVSAFLNIDGLNREGYGNAYYAAAVKSMLMNWHNFFFNSFDPNGFITIDKPPVDFWIQALFAWIFGFHGWALLLPQAIAGVCSVAVLYHLVKRIFGQVAGLIAAAVMALTPIAVAVQRTNEVDGMLVLFMLLTTWCLWKAIETKKLRWLLWAGVLEGIGFNIKMMEAYLILPALYVGYYFATKLNWRKKIVHLLSMSIVLGAISFSWAAAVDLTPASDRPYVGSTQDNSEMSLIFGYNGISRLTGDRFGGHAAAYHSGNSAQSGGQYNMGRTTQFAQSNTGAGSGGNPSGGNGGFSRSGMSGNGGSGAQWRGQFGDNPGGFNGQRMGGNFRGGGMFGTGTPGVLRLFQPALSGQISWLLPLALLSAISLLRGVRWRRDLTREESGALFWLAWLLPMAAFFSVAGFFHQYYMVTMAPAIAALTGAGLVKMWRDFQSNSRWKWLLPIAFVVDLAFEASIVWNYPTLRTVLIVISVGAAVIAAFLMSRARQSIGVKAAGTVLGLVALLISPGYWALTPILYGVSGSMPAAGPETRGSNGGGGFGNMQAFGADSEKGDAALEAYLEKHYKPSPGSYLVATLNATTAAPIILDTGLPVMAMGGFMGADPAIDVQGLEQLTKEGKLKYFLIPSFGADRTSRFGNATSARTGQVSTWAETSEANGAFRQSRMSGNTFGFGGFGGSQSALTQWITSHCKLVPSSEWESTSSSSTATGLDRVRGGLELYEYTGS
jgi:4-amino-4-deoxy-L-arabinose transferase-like glycosyltransferase